VFLVHVWTLGPWRLLLLACRTSQSNIESRAGRCCLAGMSQVLRMESSRYTQCTWQKYCTHTKQCSWWHTKRIDIIPVCLCGLLQGLIRRCSCSTFTLIHTIHIQLLTYKWSKLRKAYTHPYRLFPPLLWVLSPLTCFQFLPVLFPLCPTCNIFFSPLLLPCFPLLPSRCITCTVRGTWSSAGFHAVSFFVVWSHGPFILCFLKLVPPQAAHTPLLSTSPQQQRHLLPSHPPGLSSSAQTMCRLPGDLPRNPMGQLESIPYLGEVWRKRGGYEVMKRMLAGGK